LSDKKKKIKDKQSVTIKAPGLRTPIMLKVIEFIYTGQVNFPKMSSTEILELNKAAKYFQLPRLQYMCEKHMADSMKMDNVVGVLKAAHDLQEPTVEAFAKWYALEHYNEFVSNKDGLHILGIDLFQEVVTAFQAFAAGGMAQPRLMDQPPDTLLQDFRRMFESMFYADGKIVIDNEQIVCNRALLGAWSDKFKALLKDVPPTGVPIKGLSVEGWQQMSRFLYYGDEGVDALPACELVGFGRQMELEDLVVVCENKIRNSVDINTVISVLEVAYSPAIAHKQELVTHLKSKVFPFILEHYCEVNLQPLRMMNPIIAQDLLLKLQENFKGGRR